MFKESNDSAMPEVTATPASGGTGSNTPEYVGQLTEGKRHGQGTAVWPDGKRYMGEWKEGHRHGYGIVTWPDGQKYVGEWDEDCATGKAVLLKADGSLYVGDMWDSQRDGYGVQTYPGGAQYMGEWKKNYPYGKGVNFSPDGEQHAGEFRTNPRHGRGVEFHQGGKVSETASIYWDDGALITSDAWFGRDSHQKFELQTSRMGVPFDDGGELSREEKTFILSELLGDWILAAPGMFSLAMQASVQMLKSDVFGSEIFSSDEWRRALASDVDGVKAYAEENKLSHADGERLLRWASWSQSAERQALEAYFGQSLRELQEEVMDVELETERLVARLPRCSRHILIAGPRYRLKEFSGELIADAEKLYPWVLRRTEEGGISNDIARAARMAFPRWVENADLGDESITLLEPAFRETTDMYEGNLLRDKIAFARCLSCGTDYAEVEQSKLNSKSVGRRSSYLWEWRCPKGHLFFSKRIDVRHS